MILISNLKINVTNEEKNARLEFIKQKCSSGFLALTIKFWEELEQFHDHKIIILFSLKLLI